MDDGHCRRDLYSLAFKDKDTCLSQLTQKAKSESMVPIKVGSENPDITPFFEIL